MRSPEYSVQTAVFDAFPGYVRGVVVAHDVANGPAPDDLLELLRDAERIGP